MTTRQKLAILAFVLVLFASGCESSSPATKTDDGYVISPTRTLALARGTVTYENGCMVLNTGTPDDGYTLVWPLDQYSIEIKSDRVIFEDHTAFETSGEWIFGSEISVGGGTHTYRSNIGFPHPPIPDHCPENLWMIGSAVITR